jgi:tRNA dimethylallyltransferase
MFINVMTTSHLLTDIGAFLQKATKPLIVVLGPTASGKTAFSVALARKLGNVEIVNADSRQLYKHLDIGTAKITPEEMQGVPHHLLDVVDPREDITAADYQLLAEKAIAGIRTRGHLPMLVGGSMLHISSIIDGLRFPSPPDSALRLRLEKEYDADAGATLYARLQSVDPETASSFAKENKPYVIRALEIYETTGEKPSVVRTRGDSAHDLFIIGINRDDKTLSTRIDARARAMVRGGWIDEVKKLRLLGYGPNDPGMKSHGYREIMEFIDSGDTGFDFLAKTIATKTRQYAKRQRTWWRGDERIRWIDPDQAVL